jgi:hypothetical protein
MQPLLDLLMFVRLPFLLLLLLSLAFGPVKVTASCALPTDPGACHNCCSEPGAACCATAGQSAPAQAPASVAPQSADAKQLLSPAFVFLCFSPVPPAEQPSILKRHAARMPVPPRLDLTCIRLI